MTERHTPSSKRPAHDKELTDCLVELSIGVSRFAMYPPGHPALAPVVENVRRRLSSLLEQRGSLSVGVAQRQLVSEGTTTDMKHPVLADLADRLRSHHLGALSFDRGVAANELSE